MPQPFLPGVRPMLPDATVRHLLAAAGIDSSERPALLGLRGFYGPNARNVYDDALFLTTPAAVFAFNANTDPSRYVEHIAQLKPGVYAWKLGTHHPGTPGAYPCLVQDGPFTVVRADGVEETGEFYIHAHRGGNTVTSSLGCQTIPPTQWERFYSCVRQALESASARSLPYYLTEFSS